MMWDPINSLEEAKLLKRGSDLRDLRQAFGYARWDVISGSYGVPFARAAMRLDPEAVLAIGPGPDLTDLLRRDVPFFVRTLSRVFQGCEAEASCRKAFPDLEKNSIEPTKNYVRTP